MIEELRAGIELVGSQQELYLDHGHNPETYHCRSASWKIERIKPQNQKSAWIEKTAIYRSWNPATNITFNADSVHNTKYGKSIIKIIKKVETWQDFKFRYLKAYYLLTVSFLVSQTFVLLKMIMLITTDFDYFRYALVLRSYAWKILLPMQW